MRVADPVLLAAGDIATCGSTGQNGTAAIVAGEPSAVVAALGDLAYESGSEQEFRDCYGPSWGRFASRTKPALGNHEYGNGKAEGAFARFSTVLPAPGGWYSYELGAWHVIVLNSNCELVGGCGEGSPQEQWLAADLARHDSRCTLAYWHHPRYSSGLHGDQPVMATLWDDLTRAHADLVLAGHDHDYERIELPGQPREIVVGTGGRSQYPLRSPVAGSVVRNSGTLGVLRLVLHPSGYDWRFLRSEGPEFEDHGSDTCR